MTTMTPRDFTLLAYDDATFDTLTPFDADRVLVELEWPEAWHSPTWTETVDLRTGYTVEVRNVPCGADCLCFGAVRLV